MDQSPLYKKKSKYVDKRKQKTEIDHVICLNISQEYS